MFLLNDKMITTHKKRGGLLSIEPFQNSNLCPTYYYFTLGRQYRLWNVEKNDWHLGELSVGNEVLEVKPKEFVLIQSEERFRCSKQCMAIFGQSSSLIRKGLSLRNSPFIDPNFPDEAKAGYLELGLKNELTKPLRLRLGERIGKVCFFNVSDTYPISDVVGTVSEEDFERRSGKGPPFPVYDDDPDHGQEYYGVETYGRRKRQK